jgi:beta-lactamase class A
MMRQFTNWDQVSTELSVSSPGITWSVAIDRNFLPVVRVNPKVLVPSASVGKIFILMAALEHVDRGVFSLDQLVDTSEVDPVTDSGIMQYLSSTSYSIADLCILIASVSDNRAANALIDLVGLPAIQQVSRNLGFVHTRVLDRIRDIRLSGQPEAPSCGNAEELLEMINMIAENDPRITDATLLRQWLSLNTDTSMVASSFLLDPLAHGAGYCQLSDQHPLLWNKTGTDKTVRADCGSVTHNKVTWTYAALAHWESEDPESAASVMWDLQSLGALMSDSSYKPH